MISVSGRSLHPSLPYRAGEVVWAARHEHARTVDDVLARRTRALLLDARASQESSPRVAALLLIAGRRYHPGRFATTHCCRAIQILGGSARLFVTTASNACHSYANSGLGRCRPTRLWLELPGGRHTSGGTKTICLGLPIILPFSFHQLGHLLCPGS